MFAKLLSALSADAPEQLGADDVQVSLAALMVRIARADGDYSAGEVAQIEAVLTDRFALDAASVTQLREDAEVLEAEAPDTVRFTRAIKEAVPYDDRFAVVQSLWSVVLADGERDDEEDAQLRLMSNLLGINDRDSALARQRAAR